MLLRRTLQHILIASSVLLKRNTLLSCARHTKELCSDRHVYISRTGRNESAIHQAQLRTVQSSCCKLKHSPARITLQQRKREIRTFKEQGIQVLTLNRWAPNKMEGPCQQEQLGVKLPEELKGMKTLIKAAFETRVTLPCVIVSPADLQKVMYMVKPFLFKMQKLNAVMDYDEATIVMKSDDIDPAQVMKSDATDPAQVRKSDATDPAQAETGGVGEPPLLFNAEGHKFKHNAKSKVVLLNPDSVKSFEDFGPSNVERLACANVTAKHFAHTAVSLTYENFSAEEILKAVLPSMLSSFTSVGHIVQCNLREEHADYRYIIGQVLLDKVPQCETVVSKTHGIDSVYRNFKMELLAGKDKMVTVHKEHGCTFKMDFSKVYWNSRLSAEHERVVKDIQQDDLVLDVFAGVGPFSIPAARKGAKVVANDLNPDSVSWLRTSIELNARQIKYPIVTCNKDARHFLREDARAQLLRWIRMHTPERALGNRVRVVMNLPASAIEFVKHLRVLSGGEFEKLDKLGPLPVLYLYVFLPKMNLETKQPVVPEAEAAELFAAHGLAFDAATMNVRFVRNVAPNKNMHKVVVLLGRAFLVQREGETDGLEKRQGDGGSVEERRKRMRLDE